MVASRLLVWSISLTMLTSSRLAEAGRCCYGTQSLACSECEYAGNACSSSTEACARCGGIVCSSAAVSQFGKFGALNETGVWAPVTLSEHGILKRTMKGANEHLKEALHKIKHNKKKKAKEALKEAQRLLNKKRLKKAIGKTREKHLRKAEEELKEAQSLLHKLAKRMKNKKGYQKLNKALKNAKAARDKVAKAIIERTMKPTTTSRPSATTSSPSIGPSAGPSAGPSSGPSWWDSNFVDDAYISAITSLEDKPHDAFRENLIQHPTPTKVVPVFIVAFAGAIAMAAVAWSVVVRRQPQHEADGVYAPLLTESGLPLSDE